MQDFEKDWDSYAELINQRIDSPEWEVLKKARETHWQEFFDVQHGDKILDAGCGLGDYTVLALKKKAKVWAFDVSHEMVECTVSRARRMSLNAEAVTQDSVMSIQYPDETFDKVFCLAVLDHLSEQERFKALGELTRVLKSGGKLYLDVPNRLAYHWRIAFVIMRLLSLYPHGKVHFFTPWELKKCVKSCGLLLEKSMGLTFCPPFSGIYTTDIRRMTFFPKVIIDLLDRLYLVIEINFRRLSVFKPFCWHYFVEAVKPAACRANAEG
jgi:2-polyprenyl-3-methyl-5-hydroxy-6-metoxy-1,4-benzoquinol methylase